MNTSKFVREGGVIVGTRVHRTDFTDMSNDDMLVKARALLHGRWVQGSNALKSNGLPTPPTSAEAVCFCLRGACIRVLNPQPHVLSTDLHVETSFISTKIRRALGFRSSALLVQWNDTQGRTEKQVIEHINRRLSEMRKDKGHEQVHTEVGQ